MPELPEVESIRLGLEKLLLHQTIKNVAIIYPKIFRGDKRNVIDGKVKSIRRFAKVLSIDLNNLYSILIHVKMTGRLIYDGTHLTKEIRIKNEELFAEKHTHVIFYLDQGGKLYFNDMRKFGWVEIIKTDSIHQLPFIKKLGPEPFAGLSLEIFRALLATSKSPIKQVLMDQEKIGGIGNIYANDALWLAKIHPVRWASSLTDSEKVKLYGAILEVLTNGLARGGASQKDYLHPDGTKGTYQEHFLVYGQKGKPCACCGGVIQRIELSGRGTFFCPSCQPYP